MGRAFPHQLLIYPGEIVGIGESRHCCDFLDSQRFVVQQTQCILDPQVGQIFQWGFSGMGFKELPKMVGGNGKLRDQLTGVKGMVRNIQYQRMNEIFHQGIFDTLFMESQYILIENSQKPFYKTFPVWPLQMKFLMKLHKNKIDVLVYCIMKYGNLHAEIIHGTDRKVYIAVPVFGYFFMGHIRRLTYNHAGMKGYGLLPYSQNPCTMGIINDLPGIILMPGKLQEWLRYYTDADKTMQSDSPPLVLFYQQTTELSINILILSISILLKILYSRIILNNRRGNLWV